MSERYPNFGTLLGAILFGRPVPVDRTAVRGLTVSTVRTSDLGLETAILDARGAHPVERYATIEAATAGHARWCRLAETLTEITEVGYGELVADRRVRLERQKEGGDD